MERLSKRPARNAGKRVAEWLAVGGVVQCKNQQTRTPPSVFAIGARCRRSTAQLPPAELERSGFADEEGSTVTDRECESLYSRNVYRECPFAAGATRLPSPLLARPFDP